MAGKNGRQTPAERRDAFEILTDGEVRASLERRKALLRERLADHMTDRLLPGWDENGPAFKAQHEAQEAIFLDAIAEIERRLEGASAMLKAFSGRELG